MKIGDRYTIDIPDERKWYVKLWHRIIRKKHPRETVFIVSDIYTHKCTGVTRNCVGDYTVHWEEKK